MIASVIVDILNSGVDRVFDYKIPEGLPLLKGHRVIVPFAGRVIEGYVIGIKEKTEIPEDKIKTVVKILDEIPSFTDEMLELMYFMQGKYHILLADALRLFIPAQVRGNRVSVKEETEVYLNKDTDIEKFLSSLKANAYSQKGIIEYLLNGKSALKKDINRLFSAAALKKLTENKIIGERVITVSRTPYENMPEKACENFILTQKQKAATEIIEKNSPGEFLLFGVTGSGKTEIYLNRIERALNSGRGAIMLVPEISLTPQIIKIFRSRFKGSVAVLHSGLSAGERLDEWNRLRRGEARVAVGARSAVFAPIKDLGVIIIDEEHEQSYISESSPRYDTRDIAKFRCGYNKGSLIMGSATPLVESYYKALNKEYCLIELPDRINGRDMPEIIFADMRKEIRAGNNSLFSGILAERIKKVLEEGSQAMLFINRRGYSPMVICSECGYIARCVNCDVTLNYHKSEELLKCHYCGGKYGMITNCPACGSQIIRMSGAGTQKVCDELKKMFPRAKLLRMDNDTTQTKESHMRILEDFRAKKADILVGTQMIAKGHDFPDVTLVGVLDADIGLYFSDYRSIERTFSLITQVAGRAGRAEKSGEVIIQTHTPGHYVYKMIADYDYKGFYKREISLREAAKYPPFGLVFRVLAISEGEEEAKKAIKNIFEKIKEMRDGDEESFIYLNAAKSPVYRIKNKFRYQVTGRIKGNAASIIDNIYGIIELCRVKNVTSYLEINPSSMY